MSKSNLIGRKFGRLLCVQEAGRDKRKSVLWLCECDCGNKTIVVTGSLISGNTSSCGCIKRELIANRNKYHGLSFNGNGKKTRLYNIWSRMKQRCFDSNSSDFKSYGGRGIKVCDDWLDYKTFHDWAIPNGYGDNLTIERDDCNGNYEPNNCKWIPFKDQARNKRNNHFIIYNGQCKTLAEWSEILGIDSSLLRYRLKKWSVEKAFNTPIRRINNAIDSINKSVS